MVIREWACADCGQTFESSAPPEEVACPRCSSQETERAFFTPPGIKSPQTARKDEIQKDLAQTYGLQNMSNRDGAAVKGQRGPAQAHAKWGGNTDAMVAAAAKAPPSIVEGVGFSPPQPMFVGRVK